MADEVQVYSPATLPEALRLLSDGGPEVRPLAGGTDATVKQKEGLWRPRAWVNLLRLAPELAFIHREGDVLRIGALTPFGDILRSATLAAAAPLLLQAARTVGGPAIRNLATIGGNLGTASPAGDSLPALCALDAILRLVSLQGERDLPVGAFFLGPGKTVLRPGELIHSLAFPAQGEGERSVFEKLGLRAAHAISLASVAIRLGQGKGGDGAGRPTPPRGFALARVALGAVAPTVLRVPAAEAVLTQQPLKPNALREAAWAARTASRPITDIRASADYRRAMAENLVLRGLVKLTGWEEAIAHA